MQPVRVWSDVEWHRKDTTNTTPRHPFTAFPRCNRSEVSQHQSLPTAVLLYDSADRSLLEFVQAGMMARWVLRVNSPKAFDTAMSGTAEGSPQPCPEGWWLMVIWERLSLSRE